MKGGLIGVVVVGLVTWFGLALTPVDPIPNGVTCIPYRGISPLVEVTAKSPRANGVLVERHALGCTLYYFESRGD